MTQQHPGRQLDRSSSPRYASSAPGSRRPLDPAPQPPGRHPAPAIPDRPDAQQLRSTATQLSSIGDVGPGYDRRSSPTTCPTGSPMVQRHSAIAHRSRRQPQCSMSRDTTRRSPGRWGEAAVRPRCAVPQPYRRPSVNRFSASYIEPASTIQLSHLRPRRLLVRHRATLLNGSRRATRPTTTYNSFDPFPAGHTGEVGDADFYDAAGALCCPSIGCGAGSRRPTSTARAGVRTWQARPAPRPRSRHLRPGEFTSYFRPPALRA